MFRKRDAIQVLGLLDYGSTYRLPCFFPNKYQWPIDNTDHLWFVALLGHTHPRCRNSWARKNVRWLLYHSLMIQIETRLYGILLDSNSNLLSSFSQYS
jgi:hypothetical protein